MPDNPTEMRFAGKFRFERATSHFFYAPGNHVAALIHDFKYRNYPSLARHLGTVVGSELLASGWLSDIDFVCPIPLHWWKYTSRGYNQAEEFARGISRIADIDLSLELKSTRPHRTQTSFSHSDRFKNVRGIFRLSHPERYAGKTILLVDDVCTTGATLTSAAETIQAAQPDVKIVLLTMAVTF
ncbi:MAG: ComF family protein [Muribaculaceae bacterium]|nr:ComF family protein [Muribaculaceae bacterium]